MIQFLKNIWMIMTLNCEQSAQLTSQSFDRELNWAEKTAISTHQLICSKSRKLDRQMVLMNQAFDRVFKREGAQIAESLSDAARARIRERLSKETY